MGFEGRKRRFGVFKVVAAGRDAPGDRAGVLRERRWQEQGEGGVVLVTWYLWRKTSVAWFHCRKTSPVPHPGAGNSEGRQARRGDVPVPDGRVQPGRHVPDAGCGRPGLHHARAVPRRSVQPRRQSAHSPLFKQFC